MLRQKERSPPSLRPLRSTKRPTASGSIQFRPAIFTHHSGRRRSMPPTILKKLVRTATRFNSWAEWARPRRPRNSASSSPPKPPSQPASITSSPAEPNSATAAKPVFKIWFRSLIHHLDRYRLLAGNNECRRGYLLFGDDCLGG